MVTREYSWTVSFNHGLVSQQPDSHLIFTFFAVNLGLLSPSPRSHYGGMDSSRAFSIDSTPLMASLLAAFSPAPTPSHNLGSPAALCPVNGQPHTVAVSGNLFSLLKISFLQAIFPPEALLGVRLPNVFSFPFLGVCSSLPSQPVNSYLSVIFFLYKV